MTTTRFQSIARTTVLAVAIGAGVFGAAGIASAETYSAQDEQYLAQLADGDIPVVDESKAIILAYAVCGEFDSGASFDTVVGEFAETGLSDNEIGYVIGSAIGSYCPEHVTVIPQ